MKKIFFCLSFVLLFCSNEVRAQFSGTPNNLRVKVDANGYLIAAGVLQTSPVTSCQFSNCRLSVDSSGSLNVVVTGGTISGAITIVVNNLTGTPADGLVLANNTAATAISTLQISPRLRFRANVWDTGTLTNKTSDVWWENHAISGNPITSIMAMGASDNGGTAYFPIKIGNLIPGITAYSAIWFVNSAANPSNTNFAFLGKNDGTDNVVNTAAGGTLSLRVQNTNIVQINSSGFNLGTTLWEAIAPPTIASGGCTSPAITNNNGTAAFLITIGTSCTGVKTITLTFPAAAHFWACSGDNHTSDAAQQTNYPVARATSTTAVVITSYDRTTNVQEDFTASNTYLMHCTAE